MKIPRDKIMHLILGNIALAATLLLVLVFEQFGAGPAAALATTLVGVGYELQQKIRGEGEPSWQDAAATALPGWVAWLVLAA